MDLRKQLITALALAAVLAVLAAVYLLLNGSEQENGGGQTFLGGEYEIALADIQKAQFRYADPSLPDMTLERVGGQWRIAEPIQAPAVQERVDALFRFLKQPIRKRVQGDMSEFGLTEPTASAELHTPSKTLTFLFGRKSVSHGMYVKEKSESGAFIMEAYLLDEILVSPSDLRDRRLMPFSSDEAARVQIERRGKPVVSIERADPNADWRLASPIKAGADQAAVQRFLDALLSLNAEQFLPPVEAPFEWSAAVETFDGGRRVLYMGRSAAEGRLLAVDENGNAYEASDSFLAQLPKEAFAWREKRVADFQRTETTRVDIENRYGAFALERPSTAGNEWRVVEPAERTADGGLMSDLLFQLDSAQALRILSEDGKDAAAYGFNRPRVRIRFNSGSNGATIEIGAEVEGGAAVRSSRSPLIAAYRMEDLRGWMEGPAAFRSKRLLDYETSEAQRIQINNGRESFTLARGGFVQWRIEKPHPEAADTEAVERINIGLRDLRAARFYSEPPPVSKTGLDRPRLTAALTLQDGRAIKLLFGKEAPDGVYARMEEDADVFTAPTEAFDLLNASLDELRAKR